LPNSLAGVSHDSLSAIVRTDVSAQAHFARCGPKHPQKLLQNCDYPDQIGTGVAPCREHERLDRATGDRRERLAGVVV